MYLLKTYSKKNFIIKIRAVSISFLYSFRFNFWKFSNLFVWDLRDLSHWHYNWFSGSPPSQHTWLDRQVPCSILLVIVEVVKSLLCTVLTDPSGVFLILFSQLIQSTLVYLPFWPTSFTYPLSALSSTSMSLTPNSTYAGLQPLQWSSAVCICSYESIYLLVLYIFLHYILNLNYLLCSPLIIFVYYRIS